MTSAAAAPRGLRAYAVLLRRGEVSRPFAAACVARLPIAVVPLASVVLVHAERGTYTVAGVVSGAFAAGTAVGAPVWGRAMDRRAQARVIAPTVLASALALVALGLLAPTRVPDAVLVVVAALAGLAFPPFSAAMRASWRLLTGDPVSRRTGFAVDAASVETLFVVGPLLFSLLLVATTPLVPLLVTAGILAAGGLAYSASGPARRHPAAGAAAGPAAGAQAPDTAALDTAALHAGALDTAGLVGAPGRRGRGPLAAVVSVALAQAVAFGLLDTTMTAAARTVLHAPGHLGYLFAAIAGGSTVGGLVYGTRLPGRREPARLPPLLGGFAAGLAVVTLVLGSSHASALLLAAPLFVAGLCIAPSLIVQQNLVDAAALPGRATEAQTWLSTAVTSGAAAGTALAGVLVDRGGVTTSLGAAVVALAVAALLALGLQRAWRPALG